MTEIQKTIAAYVLRSAGTANHLTNHSMLCLIGMIESGEASLEDFYVVGGEVLVDYMRKGIEQWAARNT